MTTYNKALLTIGMIFVGMLTSLGAITAISILSAWNELIFIEVVTYAVVISGGSMAGAMWAREYIRRQESNNVG